MNEAETIKELKKRVRGRPEYLKEKYFAEITTSILNHMRKNDISRKDLADEMGVSSSQISQIFNKHSNLTLGTIAKISSALGIRLRFEMKEVFMREVEDE